MQRINVLLNKISDLSKKAEKIDLIEVDLMLDYTRVLYADLVELRNKKVYNTNSTTSEQPIQEEPAVEVVTKNEETVTKEEVIVEKTEQVPVNEMPVPKPTISTPLPTNKNIKQFIGINDKYQFISELFDNDTSAYDKVISDINSFNTAHKALEWLENEVSKDRDWNEDNDSVKMFYDTVSNFFASI